MEQNKVIEVISKKIKELQEKRKARNFRRQHQVATEKTNIKK